MASDDRVSVQAQDQDGNAKARATEAAEAGVNLTMAKVKLDLALGTATTAEIGAGAVATVYLAISATGNFVAATAQTVGAGTGKTKEAETAAEVASTVTSASGLVTLVATRDLHKGAAAAAAEDILTSNPKDLKTGGSVVRAAKALDLAQNIRTVEQIAKEWIIHSIP